MRLLARLLPIFILLASGFALAFTGGAIGTAQAQEPEIPELPAMPGTGEGIHILAIPLLTFSTVPELGTVTFPIQITDRSLESAFLYTPSTQVNCELANSTPIERGWSVGFVPAPSIGRNQQVEAQLVVSAGVGAAPRTLRMEVACVAGNPLYSEVGRFDVTAQVEAYTRFSFMPQGVPPRAGPDEPVTIEMELRNSGNVAQRFYGQVQAPVGWTFQDPAPVVVEPGSAEVVEITGLAPREKLWYRPEASIVIISFWPDGQPERAQHQYVPATVQGFYFHPALVPATVLGLVALFLLIMLIAYARRTIEEQVLGKPVPPWQIPVERAYLKELQETDPDEFYIVRYYLMVEEHRSALLWYKHYKHMTRKDRKRERVWIRRKKKVDHKRHRRETRLAALNARFDRRSQSLDDDLQWQEFGLRRRSLRLASREQRKLLKIHRKAVQRIDKLSSARVKAAQAAYEKQKEKELKLVAKENKKRAKRGDELLPAPEFEPFRASEPEFPEPVEVPILDLPETVLATRWARAKARSERRAQRWRTRAERKQSRKTARLRKQLDRLEARLPPEPETHLYEEDEFVPSEEVMMADDRGVFARLFRVKPLETRDAIRRRRQVYRARLKKAKRLGDEEAARRAKEEFLAERARLREGRAVAPPAAPPVDGEPPAAADAAASKRFRLRRGKTQEPETEAVAVRRDSED